MYLKACTQMLQEFTAGAKSFIHPQTMTGLQNTPKPKKTDLKASLNNEAELHANTINGSGIPALVLSFIFFYLSIGT